MNKRKGIIIALIFIAIAILFSINNKSCAAQNGDLDLIESYIVTVDPDMSDGSLDIIYEIQWKVLDSNTEGPLTWVHIGTPNEYFSSPQALTENIREIKADGSNVRIDFDRPYVAGEEITFKYSIHQECMYRLKKKKCTYEFTPAWFTDAKVERILIKWNKDSVKKANNDTESGNYYVWTKENLDHGEKIKTKVEYKKDAFGYLAEDKQAENNSGRAVQTFMIIFFMIIIIVICISAGGGGGDYYGHRGFYGGYHSYYHSGCAHSSCACASSCAHSSCACACAGSGRAGCSKKDFYGTNLETKKIKEALK